ncbi:hypothetical protein AZ66_15330 [Paenibacillus sp. E194]|jgi:YlzJ-like protein|uniref:YlzJ-like family protein n=4 Tax=Paenibacillus TaxID=44249 RepID=A0A383R8F2_PAEAL|nr:MULTISPECIES: YlzJ-like family protein [Paenibacillus]EPY04028.1 hypothetical protein PAALTS15_26304 [Paenibacillus alvei TS-15]EPY10003.1 hypothetical protein PAAL66ix_22685 [Paenibacillus alvei A6-6i-x]KJB87062.1 hypothetical protein AZ66_15330 [Paenibacillus sp. E194]MCM3291659.1 YlzJ-like family protein [Paenibacillus sp. MER 180]MCY9531245.1 YlzJ-like family protein [Paenibacillus alvei]
MLHTIIPMEQVLQGIDKEPSFFEMQWQGRTLLVQQVDNTTVRIERLLKDTSMHDFLDPGFSPGTIIPLR